MSGGRPKSPSDGRLVPQDELDRMVALLAEGRTLEQVGAELGVTGDAIRIRVMRLERRDGVCVERARRGEAWCKPKVSDERLLGLLRAGLTLREVAAAVPMSYGNLRNRVGKLRARGLAVPPLYGAPDARVWP